MPTKAEKSAAISPSPADGVVYGQGVPVIAPDTSPTPAAKAALAIVKAHDSYGTTLIDLASYFEQYLAKATWERTELGAHLRQLAVAAPLQSGELSLAQKQAVEAMISKALASK